MLGSGLEVFEGFEFEGQSVTHDAINLNFGCGSPTSKRNIFERSLFRCFPTFGDFNNDGVLDFLAYQSHLSLRMVLSLLS